MHLIMGHHGNDDTTATWSGLTGEPDSVTFTASAIVLVLHPYAIVKIYIMVLATSSLQPHT